MAADRRARRRARRLLRAARPRRLPTAAKMMGIGAAGAVLVPAQMAMRKIAPKARPRVPSLFHKLTCRSLGVSVRKSGPPARNRSVLFVVNHISWVDIPVLGSALLASFVAKAEVDGWGLIGYLGRLQRTIYVERERRQAVGEQAGAIAARLAEGGRVILFPEGTNSDGTRVLPFKSSLFAMLEGPGTEDFLIQPVTLAYTRVNGLPVTRQLLPAIAWVGDIALGPHIAAFSRLGRVQAEILLHAPVRRADFGDRKALARHCHDVVAAGYARLMRGDDDLGQAPAAPSRVAA